MLRTILKTLSVLLLFSSAALAESRYGPYTANVLRIIDGDTIELSVHLWPGLTQQVKLRVNGINTPEKRGKISDCERKAGQEATTFTQRWLKDASTVTIYDIRRGKYAGRVIGELKKGNIDLSDALINAGHAKPYTGGKRQPWC